MAADKPLIDNEISAKIIAKCWLDTEFKNSLIENPVETLRKMGIECPEGVAIDVQEAEQAKADAQFVLVIPPAPKDIDLNRADLINVAASKCSGTWHNLCGSS